MIFTWVNDFKMLDSLPLSFLHCMLNFSWIQRLLFNAFVWDLKNNTNFHSRQIAIDNRVILKHQMANESALEFKRIGKILNYSYCIWLAWYSALKFRNLYYWKNKGSSPISPTEKFPSPSRWINPILSQEGKFQQEKWGNEIFCRRNG